MKFILRQRRYIVAAIIIVAISCVTACMVSCVIVVVISCFVISIIVVTIGA
jgi:hypothetical protein